MSKQRCSFGPLDVVFDDECTLAPRPWTLLQSRVAVERAQSAPPGAFVELHCGAGHIGQAVARWSGRSIVQVDDVVGCCASAADNATRNGVRSLVVCASETQLPIRPETCALLIADPPYVPTLDTGTFPDDPVHAIDGGVDGLDGVRSTLAAATALLCPGGRLLLQVRGPDQAAAAVAAAELSHPQLGPSGIAVAADDRAVVEFVRAGPDVSASAARRVRGGEGGSR
ncbi:MAG TPA: methyltransferase [Acidimicrobiia bacterium]|nr:methyltransferase [Acidimicrobiia bacterium]